MSLVENLINQISTGGLGGITKPQNFDLNDDTFSKLLDSQMNNSSETVSFNTLGNMGAPAGLFIEPLKGAEFSETVQDQMEIVGENKISKEDYINQPIEFKDISVDDYFSTLLKSGQNNNSDFMNFAKRSATNAYNVFSKNFVGDMQDFVEDLSASL